MKQEVAALYRDFVVPRQQRQGHFKSTGSRNSSCNNNKGRWTLTERLLFLKGLRLFGKHKLKEIHLFVGTRSILQVRSHAQKIVQQLNAGINVFEELDEAERENNAPGTPPRVSEHLQQYLEKEERRRQNQIQIQTLPTATLFRNNMQVSPEELEVARILCSLSTFVDSDDTSRGEAT